MNEKSLQFPIYNVLFNFSYVVRNVVDNVHVQVVGCHVELLGKRLQRRISELTFRLNI